MTPDLSASGRPLPTQFWHLLTPATQCSLALHQRATDAHDALRRCRRDLTAALFAHRGVQAFGWPARDTRQGVLAAVQAVRDARAACVRADRAVDGGSVMANPEHEMEEVL